MTETETGKRVPLHSARLAGFARIEPIGFSPLKGQIAQDVVDRVGRLGPLDLGVVGGAAGRGGDGGLEGEGGAAAAAAARIAAGGQGGGAGAVGVGDVLLGGIDVAIEGQEPPVRVLSPSGRPEEAVLVGGGDGGRGRGRGRGGRSSFGGGGGKDLLEGQLLLRLLPLLRLDMESVGTSFGGSLRAGGQLGR